MKEVVEVKATQLRLRPQTMYELITCFHEFRIYDFFLRFLKNEQFMLAFFLF
jgi:hypothetical protein